MHGKKDLQNRIRGWLPKEPNIAIDKVNTKKPKLTIRIKPPTIRERIVGGLGAAGGGLTIIGALFYFISPIPKQFIGIELIIGISLIVIAFFVRSTYKKRK
jgi:hypothetical protein